MSDPSIKKTGRAEWLASRWPALILLAVLLLIPSAMPNIWTSVTNVVFDGYQRISPRKITRLPVAIVSIDDASIKAIGQWPWPRIVLAELIEKTADAGALAIGLNIIMPDADRFSPSQLVARYPELEANIRSRLAALPNNDDFLANRIFALPVAVGRAALNNPDAKKPNRATTIEIVGPPPHKRLLSFTGYLANVAVIDDAAMGNGFLNSDPDSDGTIRSVPAVIHVGGEVYPSLSVEMLRLALGQQKVQLDSDGNGALGLHIGDSYVPLDSDGTVRLHFSHADPRRRVSALDLLEGKIDKNFFAHQVVLIGTTALGLRDAPPTPVSSNMDAAEIQAQMIENLISGGQLLRPTWTIQVEIFLLLILGGILVLAGPNASPWRLAVLCFVPSAALAATTFGLFVQSRLLLDPSPAVVGGILITTFQLITGYANANRRRRFILLALAASEDRFRILAEATPAPTVITRLSDAGFLYANQAALDFMGWSRENLASHTSIEMWVDPGLRADFLKKLKQYGKVRDLRNQARTQDGVLHWMLLSAELIDFQGEAAVFTSFADITELLALEEQLRQSQKMEMVGQLTGGIAHDFNNMLVAVIGNLDLLQISGSKKDESDKDYIETALQAAFRAADLTHRLLAFSRQQDLNAKVIEVNDILPQFQQLAKHAIGADIEIEIRPAANLWLTVVDAGQLENALLNLAINARDAMPEGGHLTIETANRVLDEDYTSKYDDLTPGDYVTVTVSDDGTGMPAEVRARVFEPFFTTKDVGKGSGLGLSMVFGFAQQSGGQVSVYSEEGEGTTVRIYLPREDQAESVDSSAEEGKQDIPTGDETILVVEDDEEVLRYLVTVLGRLGYTVLQAEDGPAALEVMAASGAIDLLLTDMILPRGMSGRDVANAFREQHPASGVLYSSGYTREVLNRRGGLEDAAALMNKPYQTQALAQQVREVMDARK